MKYNKNIEKQLMEIDNSECRKTNDPSSDEYIHDNQLEAAKEVIKSFTAHISPLDEHDGRNNHVVLVAKMQSGKTGTCNGIINILTKTKLGSYFHIENYFYITGMNDNGLHDQTVERICGDKKGQVIEANEYNVCNGEKEIDVKPNAKFFVQKNSDLRKNKIKLSNCLIFIDESHFGSNKKNVLTKFLEENGIDWKNGKALKEKHIYIVSVSATPFDEIISDIADCKEIVELKTSKGYVGVSEYLEAERIYDAKKSDFKMNKKTGETPIVEYLKEAYKRIKENNNKGVIFIRTRDKNIRKHGFIQDNFSVVELDASKGGSIDYNRVYEKIQSMIDAITGTESHKPIIFFIKGAYRAGITLDPKHKDQVFMIYDDSSKSEATAQGLLGRMCGYRSNNDFYTRTMFYVNKQHAEDYGEWEEDFREKENIPATKRWEWADPDSTDLNAESKISTKGIDNIIINLSDQEIKRFLEASMNKDISRKEFAKTEVRILKPNLKFEYMGEVYINGKNMYGSLNVIQKWFYEFYGTNCPSYRPDKYFREVTGRDVLTDKDIGKKIIHIVLDAEVDFDENKNIVGVSGNKQLLVYHSVAKTHRSSAGGMKATNEI